LQGSPVAGEAEASARGRAGEELLNRRGSTSRMNKTGGARTRRLVGELRLQPGEGGIRLRRALAAGPRPRHNPYGWGGGAAREAAPGCRLPGGAVAGACPGGVEAEAALEGFAEQSARVFLGRRREACS